MLAVSSFIVYMLMIYNIMACSIPNKYRWTTLKSILLNDREVGPNHAFVSLPLISVPCAYAFRSRYQQKHVPWSTHYSFKFCIHKMYYLCIDYTTIFKHMTSNTIIKLWRIRTELCISLWRRTVVKRPGKDMELHPKSARCRHWYWCLLIFKSKKM